MRPTPSRGARARGRPASFSEDARRRLSPRSPSSEQPTADEPNGESDRDDGSNPSAIDDGAGQNSFSGGHETEIGGMCTSQYDKGGHAGQLGSERELTYPLRAAFPTSKRVDSQPPRPMPCERGRRESRQARPAL